MNKASRIFLTCASSLFALCCAGLLVGLIYTLVRYFWTRQTIEHILGGSIPFYKALGALGAIGFLLFFLFLFSLMSGPTKHKKP